MDSVTCHHFVVFVRSVRSQRTNKSTHASRSNTGTSLIKEWKRDRFRSYFSSHPLVLEWSHETGPPPGISQSYHHSFLKTSDCDESALCNNIQDTNVYVVLEHVVFEREAREFQSSHFFVFRSCDSNHKISLFHISIM